jgi:hypothetical protein
MFYRQANKLDWGVDVELLPDIGLMIGDGF